MTDGSTSGADTTTGAATGSTIGSTPWFAAGYDVIMRPVEAAGVRAQRRRIGRAARGRVLEIAAGTGAMLGHYGPEVTEVIATEPDAAMLRRAGRRAASAGVPVHLCQADAQRLPVADGSIDSVVVALSLCTIPDVAQALAEARRVLAADGQLLFVEHVRSLRPILARAQAALTPVWKRLAGGCHLDRASVAAIERAGFELTDLWRSGGRRGVLVQGRAVPR